MMKLPLTISMAVAVTAPALAHAAKETPVEKLVTTLAYRLEGEPFAKPEWTSTVEQMSKMEAPSVCWDAVKDLADDAHVHSSQAFRWKTAQKDDGGTYITGAEVKGLCKRYEATYVHEYVEAAVVEAFLAQSTMKQAVEGQYESEAKQVGRVGEECAKRVDAALAYGLAASEPIESSRYDLPAVELGAAKATYCQPAIDFAAARVKAIGDLAQAKHDAIVAVYAKAGIKGKRLELYVSYGMPDDTGFLARGCESYVTSLKALKSAKVLFVWLEGDSGYTIRKFSFRGDSYAVTEHEYSTKEGAYAGCR